MRLQNITPLSSKEGKAGFTLIELSIVLVIIGLIIGGILTGQDLIAAAAQRAQIAQIEKYNTAVRTFQGKYGYLPGDIPDPTASNFGFIQRGDNGYAGDGDGNGIVEGNLNDGNQLCDTCTGTGELATFWADLTKAQLIDASIVFSTMVSGSNGPSFPGGVNSALITSWLPPAKIASQSNYVFVYAMGGANYYNVAAVTSMGTLGVNLASNPGLTPLQAYNIDKKTDDGLPQSGSVTACLGGAGQTGTGGQYWAAGGGNQGAGGANCAPTTTGTTPLATDCFGNNGATGAMTYSIKTNGNVQNCALSFRFQ